MKIDEDKIASAFVVFGCLVLSGIMLIGVLVVTL